ncbi:MAG TPA: mechanosensitive ion channel family protein [Spongiibacteraceae bacterium]|jgi:small conductance mechanosensitive channel|nr:mechanosensitive ion channel family protein [Spongiibacteraceae bacterium]HUH37845.1 mechanosensitive ion channel family protein [Spongiibacteraceae bacterium]
MDLELDRLTTIYDQVVAFLVAYSFQLAGALIIILLGLWLGARTGKLLLRLCERHGLDITLSRFLANIGRLLVIAIMVIIALGKIGISIAPFVAALGAIGLGAGLAFQGLLSNYVAGLNLIITRPFVVGDTITVQGVTGQVQEVKLAATLLCDEDDVLITIPNKHIIGEILCNSGPHKIVERSVGISYGSDPQQAVQAIREALANLPHINTEREAQVGIAGFGDSSVDIALRCWVETGHYFTTVYAINQAVFQALDQAGIEIPFPQREVRLLGNTTGNA